MTEIIISKSEVIEEEISDLATYQDFGVQTSWHLSAGLTEYKLYSYLSKKVNNSIILDIGTMYGGSALALSHNLSNKVISYDIVEFVTHSCLKKENIELRIADFMQDNIDYSRVAIIMIDVDPHDGIQEPLMIQFLVDSGWSGILLMDDISDMFPGLKVVWDRLEYEKYDLTDIGHFSGTGLVNLGDKFSIKVIN